MKHNNEIPNNHFRKEWDLRVRTWFEQPARKIRRRKARASRAVRGAPRPIDGALRPIVRCQSVKYNSRARLGRGFSPEELREASIGVGVARTLGISVDARRKNRSVEGLQVNVQRLREYKGSLIVFPRVAGRPKAGDSVASLTSVASSLARGELLPLRKTQLSVGMEPLGSVMRANNAYRTLRIEMTNAKYRGVREKRARDAATEEEDKKK